MNDHVHPVMRQALNAAAIAEPIQDWIFTFGVDHPLGKCFVRIHGTFNSAREEMVRRFGLKWAFQYRTEDEAGTKKYGLQEIPS